MKINKTKHKREKIIYKVYISKKKKKSLTSTRSCEQLPKMKGNKDTHS